MKSVSYQSVKQVRRSLVGRELPTNQGFLRLFSTVRLTKYSRKPRTGLACGCTEMVPSTAASLPADTSARSDQPSEPTQPNQLVAPSRPAAAITPATSWSDPKTITPVNTGMIDVSYSQQNL